MLQWLGMAIIAASVAALAGPWVGALLGGVFVLIVGISGERYDREGEPGAG